MTTGQPQINLCKIKKNNSMFVKIVSPLSNYSHIQKETLYHQITIQNDIKQKIKKNTCCCLLLKTQPVYQNVIIKTQT